MNDDRLYDALESATKLNEWRQAAVGLTMTRALLKAAVQSGSWEFAGATVQVFQIFIWPAAWRLALIAAFLVLWVLTIARMTQ